MKKIKQLISQSPCQALLYLAHLGNISVFHLGMFYGYMCSTEKNDIFSVIVSTPYVYIYFVHEVL